MTGIGERVSNDGVASGVAMNEVGQDKAVAALGFHGVVNRRVEDAGLTRQFMDRRYKGFEPFARLPGKFRISHSKSCLRKPGGAADADAVGRIAHRDQRAQHRPIITPEPSKIERCGCAGVARIIGAIEDHDKIAALRPQQVLAKPAETIVGSRPIVGIGRILKYSPADALVVQVQTESVRKPVSPTYVRFYG